MFGLSMPMPKAVVATMIRRRDGIHELALCRVTIGSAHLPVIARDGDARAPEGARDFVHCRCGGAIDDAGALQALDTPGSSRELRRARHDIDGEAKVVAVRRCNDHPWIVQPQPFGDVLADSRRCSCRKGKHRRIAQALSRVAETQVGGPEVVPPLGDAVGLIDAQKRRPRAFEQGSGRGQLQCLWRRENHEAATLLE